MIRFQKINETYGKIQTLDNDALWEIKDYCQFQPEGYRFNKKYKYGAWSGKIQLVGQNGEFPLGLLKIIVKFCVESKYKIEISDTLKTHKAFESKEEFDKWVDSKEIWAKGERINPYWYQRESVFQALQKNRGIINAPTSAGKSLMIALLAKWFSENFDQKILVIVPTTSLTAQMKNDLIDYRLFKESDIAEIRAGTSHFVYDKTVVVQTWQSAHKKDPEWFEQFGMMITDECFHGDTLIKTPSGDKKIKDFKPGDKIYQMNEESGEVIIDEVVKLHENLVNSQSEKMYELEMDNGEILKVTGNHKFLTKNRGWVRADELTGEDDIIDFSEKQIFGIPESLLKKQDGVWDMKKFKKYNIFEKLKEQFPFVKPLLNELIFCYKNKINKPIYCKCDRCKNVIDEPSRKIVCKLHNHQKYYLSGKDYDEYVKKVQNSKRGQPAWNAGLKGDPRLKEFHWQKKHPEKWEEFKKKIQEERLGENNPMFDYGNNPKYDKSRELMSKKAKENILSGKFTPKTENRNTHWKSFYNNKTYRSSWESAFQQIHPDFEYEKIRIPYFDKNLNKNRVYISDFIDLKTKTIFEIRPSRLFELQQDKFDQIKKYCFDNGYAFKHIDIDYLVDNNDKIDYNLIDENSVRKLKNAIEKYKRNRKA